MWEKIPLDYYALAGLLNFITSAALAIVVFFKNPKSRTNQTFSLFAFTVAGWSLCYFLWLRAGSARLAEVYLRTLMLFVIFIPTTFTHFILTLLKVDVDKRKKLNFSNYLVSSLLGLTVYTRWFASDIGPFLVFPYWLKPRILFFFHTIHFFANTLYSHSLMLRVLKHNSGVFKNQILYVFIGTAIGYIAGAINYLTWYRIPIPPFLNPLVSIYVTSISYAIVKYRLMDVNLAVTRTTVFMVVYAVLLGLPLAGALTWQGRLEQALGARWWVWLWGTCALLATAAHYVNLYVQRRAEARLLKEQRRYQMTLMNAAEGMVQIHDLTRLLSLIVHLLTRAMRLTHAGVFLRDERTGKYVLKCSRDQNVLQPGLILNESDPLIHWLQEQREPVICEEVAQQAAAQVDSPTACSHVEASLRKIEAAVVIPSFSEKGLLGFLVLGDKKTGQMYGQDDLNVLQTLANQAAMAVQNARFYESEKERQAALFHTASLASLGTMASSMGHQINNRFNVLSVLGSAQKARLTKLLAETALDAVARQTVEEDLRQFQSVLEEAMKGGEVVAAIRKLSRPSTDGHKPVAIAEALNAGLGVVKFKIKLETIDFLRNLPEDLPTIHGDMAQLGECFLNLIDNAYDAMKKKEAAIVIPGYRGVLHVAAKAAVEHGKRWVIIETSDNGIGMTEKTLENVFVPFFTTKATAEKGTGLGLYVIKKIIEAHGGRVAVASTYGQGTTVTIHLPALAGERTGA